MAASARPRVSYDGKNLIVPPATSTLPQFGTIDEFTRQFGPKRRTVYELIGAGHIRAIKLGGRTLIDFHQALTYFQSLPAAQIRAPRHRESASPVAE